MKPTSPPATDEAPPPVSPLVAPILAGLFSWVAISVGFFGLTKLMSERPEFVGPPMRATKAELVQDSPQVVARKVTDDIAVVTPVHPEFSDVRFDMTGRRDYRGLRTLLDMSGQFQARYVLSNAFDEPIFLLFKCPYPRSQTSESQNLLAGDLRMQAPAGGISESSKEAWYWSGTVGPNQSAEIQIAYHVASLKGVTYRVEDKNGSQHNRLRVTIHRKDLPSMHFESGEGSQQTAEETVVWERKDFLAPDFFTAEIGESRNLFVALSQLLQIGPIICLLFLVAVSAVILVRQPLTPIQLLTIASGYAFYFPLLLYLSSRFSFAWALLIATIVPGTLLVNYARWLLGGKLGLLGAPIFLALYQVFPTLAAFAGWNRGMVLLWLGVVTLAVLINLQNRALRGKATAVAIGLALGILPATLDAAEVQVTLPAELVSKAQLPHQDLTNALIAFDPVQYRVKQEPDYFQVHAEVSFQVLRAGDTTVPLFSLPVHLQEAQFSDPSLARLVAETNQLALFVTNTGTATMQLAYRVPVLIQEGKRRAQIPALVGPSGNVQLESPRGDLEIIAGRLWSKSAGEHATLYDIGLAGVDQFVVEWRDQGTDASLSRQTAGTKEFYGIGLTRAQNLTVINSDGTCVHFAEFELPVFQNEEFRLKLPDQARLISVSVNGAEIGSPTVSDQVCRIRLPAREAQQTAHRLSFQIAYPTVRLGFVGTVRLTLPEVIQTIGTLEWVVALPMGFEAQVISSGLERQTTAADLSRFGDYGRILRAQPHTYLSKTLAPPAPVNLSLNYRQAVPGFYEPRKE